MRLFRDLTLFILSQVLGISFSFAMSFAEVSYTLMNGKCPQANSTNSTAEKCKKIEKELKQTLQTAQTMNQIVEGNFLAGLAKQRKETLDCAGLQLSDLTAPANEKKINQWADNYTETLIAIAKAKRKMQTLAPALNTQKARDDYKAAKTEANILLQGLPFSEMKSVRLMINDIVSQSDQFPEKGPEEWFRKQIKSSVIQSVRSAQKDVQRDQALLEKGIQTSGQSLDSNLRESLAQDTDLIEAYRVRNKKIEADLIPVSCRIDAKYGKGVQYRDNAVLALSILGTGGAMGFAAGAGIMSTITGVAAAGSIPLRAGRIFRILAMVGQGAQTLTEIDKACAGQRPAVSAKAGAQGQACEPDALKSMENENCFVAGALAVLNIPISVSGLKTAAGKAEQGIRKLASVEKGAKASLSKTDELLMKNGLTKEDLAAEKKAALNGAAHPKERSLVARNAAMNDPQRLEKIKKDFPHLSESQAKCVVEKVHSIGGSERGVYQYSKKEIILKARTARSVCKVGLSDVDALIRLGYAGNIPTSALADGSKELSDFEKLLKQNISAPAEAAVAKLDSNALRERLLRETNLIKKGQLRAELQEAEKVEIAENLRDHPAALDALLKGKSYTLKDIEPLAKDAKLIKLSDEKIKQLTANGSSELEALLLEVKSGDTVGYKSKQTGAGFAQLKGLDPSDPKNVILSVPDGAGKTKDISVLQTELSVTDKEKANLMAQLVKNEIGKGGFEKLLNKQMTSEEFAQKYVNELGISVTKTPQTVQAEALEQRLQEMDSHYGDDVRKLMDPRYVKTKEEYNKITSIDYEQKQILRAVREIDPQDLNQGRQAEELLKKAEAIQLQNTANKLNANDKDLLKVDIARLRKEVEEAPQKAIFKDIRELKSLNGSESFGAVRNMPDRQKFVEQSGVSINTERFQKMENLFKQNPQSLSDDSSEFLRRDGRFIYDDLNKKKVLDSQSLEVKKRLELYLRIQQTR